LSGQASLGKKIYCAAFLKPMPNFSSFSRSSTYNVTLNTGNNSVENNKEKSYLILIFPSILRISTDMENIHFNYRKMYQNVWKLFLDKISIFHNFHIIPQRGYLKKYLQKISLMYKEVIRKLECIKKSHFFIFHFL
jgi:hypothetical protein